MKSAILHYRSSGTIEQEKRVYTKKSYFRGTFQKESIQGVEEVREALNLVKMILKKERDPILKKQIAEAGVLLNDVLLK